MKSYLKVRPAIRISHADPLTTSNVSTVITVAILLFLTAAMTGCAPTTKLFREEAGGALSQTEIPDTSQQISQTDLRDLPDPVQRYLLKSNVVGKERVRSFRARMKGRIKIGEEGRWMPFRVEQYSTLGSSYTRRFFIKACMYGFIPVVGRDKYAGGAGEMLVRPLDLFTASRVTGPDMDRAALVTLLNDLFMAPAAMIDERITWEAVSDSSARAMISDDDLSVSGVFVFNDESDLVNFYTDDRAYNDGKGTVKSARWWTSFEAYRELNGVRIPTLGRARWDFGNRTFTYAVMEIEEVEYNARELE